MVHPHRSNQKGASHEWQALEHTNGLLSASRCLSLLLYVVFKSDNLRLGDRFGARYRPYLVHQAKVLSRSVILDEVSVIWKDDIEKTARRTFRGLSGGEGDNYIAFMYTQ